MSVAGADSNISMNISSKGFGYISLNTNGTSRLYISGTGPVDVPGNFTAGTIEADNGADFNGLLSSITNITVVGGVITAIS
jgi:hypothetical protein